MTKELSLDQALRKGIEAHKSGQIEEADRYYTAILKANPKHPDANHNMGVLAVGIGKVEEALPFFKKALETNPDIAQFWLSYIDALVKLERSIDARAVLTEAKEKGFSGAGFDQLDQSLKTSNSSSEADPKSQDPPQEKVQVLLNLYNEGNLQKALTDVSKLLIEFPNSIILLNISGAVYRGLGQFECALSAYEKVISLTSGSAEALFNKAIVLYDQEKLNEASELYNQILSMRPNFADAHYNLGVIHREQGHFDKAIKSFQKTLAIQPNHDDACNNLGIIFRNSGKLYDAVDCYAQGLKISSESKLIKSNLVSLLKVYSPENTFENPLVTLDAMIKKSFNRKWVEAKDDVLGRNILDFINKLQLLDNNIQTDKSQIYKFNDIDLNCRRHMSLFNEQSIISKFCFGCFKVQVDLDSVLDLIRLASLFYTINLNCDLTRKCMIEMRPGIPGTYKGLIYCRGLDQAINAKEHLDIQLKTSNSSLSSKIKRGCSEFSFTFPDYGKVEEDQNLKMDYPEDWQNLEANFDNSNVNTHLRSLQTFCLSDLLIIRKRVDYAKGVGDHSSQFFKALPVKYIEIYNTAKYRRLN